MLRGLRRLHHHAPSAPGKHMCCWVISAGGKLPLSCDIWQASFCRQGSGRALDFGREFAWQEQLYGLEGRPLDPLLANGAATIGAAAEPHADGDAESGGGRHYGPQWVYMRLSQPVTAPAVRRGAVSV